MDSNTKPDMDSKPGILLSVVAVYALLLICLSSRRRGSSHPALRLFLWGASAAYFPLMSYVLSSLPQYLSSFHNDDEGSSLLTWYVVTSVVLVQFLKANADMAALAVAAVSSPAAGDDIDSQKIRPSMESLVFSFWVAGLVIYNIYLKKAEFMNLPFIMHQIYLLWAFGAARMVLRFAAFRHASRSFALGRNAQLIEGYMAQLLEEEKQLPSATVPRQQLPSARVPRLIVTGEKNQDVEESARGYRIKPSGSLVTLDKVWSCPDVHLSTPELKDICLSFSLFKCLRRRFAGYPLAEAGSSWAFRFVCDGLLDREDDHERIFRVVATELAFAGDFYYSPLPVASLGAWYAALHFFLSFLICASLCSLTTLLFMYVRSVVALNGLTGFLLLFIDGFLLLFVAPVLSVITLSIEISEMVVSVRSNWTKINMIGHFINRSNWSKIICYCLLRCKSRRHWKDEIGQSLLMKPGPKVDPFIEIFVQRRNSYKPVIKVSREVKTAVLKSFRRSGEKLSNGIATVRRRCRCPDDFTWACYDEVTTSTDAILVWYIATSLFEIKCSAAAGAPTPTTNMVVANSLSRYCAYLVAAAPDLLPDNAAWTKGQYKPVKECVEACIIPSGAVPRSDRYQHLVESFSKERSHDVVKKGARLGKQLAEEFAGQEQGETRGEEAVWELLAEFWSEMILYLAPSDNVKCHIEALQRGGEFITLLWALLLHAGITHRPAEPQHPCMPASQPSRPSPNNPEP